MFETIFIVLIFHQIIVNLPRVATIANYDSRVGVFAAQRRQSSCIPTRLDTVRIA